MKGEFSNNPFFNKFPKIINYIYQGPLLNTAKEVENIFNKVYIPSKNLKEDKKNKNIIFLLILDEMNLNVHSPNKSFEIILSKLDYEQEEDSKIAFIGITNGKIDPPKMNKGISIFISESSEEENKEDQILTNRNKTFSEKLYKFEKF